MKILIMGLLFILISCTKKASLTKSHDIFTLKFSKIGINAVKVIPWRIGIRKKNNISRGFRITFDLPVISKSDMGILNKEKKIDSWVIKLIRSNSLSDETIAYYKAKLIKTSYRKGRSNGGFISLTRGSVLINYAASSISTRYDKLRCPAFGHRKSITEYLINKDKSKQELNISGFSSGIINGKLIPIDFGIDTVNGGPSLLGTYKFEIALYDSKAKMRRSNFTKLYEVVKIKTEKEISLKNCNNEQN